MGKKIFISYRRGDVKADARNIYNTLVAKYGTAGVFMDVHDLSGGHVFDEVIAETLVQCDVLLAVIGPNWMNVLSTRMAAGASDLMREELATALKLKRIIIPVLIDGAPLPAADGLPDDIRALVKRQAEEVGFKYFERDMESVIRAIDARRKEKELKAIKNAEQLWVWLKERPIELSRAIAARSALRALPWACNTMERLIEKRGQATPPPATIQQAGQGLSQADQDYRQAMQNYEAVEAAALESADDRLLKAFRGTATAWFAAVGSNHVTEQIKAAALAAGRDIEVLCLSLDMRVSVPAHNAAITVVADTARTRTSTLHLDPAGRYAAKAGDPSFWASSATTTGLADDLDWFDWCESGPALTAGPLWLAGAAPEDWVLRSQRLRTALLTIDPSWEVWTKWYDDRARGVPFDVEIERKRVLVPAEAWRQPPASVNTYIAQILK